MIDLLDIEFCNCGRPYCDFFNASEGENGVSYSVESVKQLLKDLPKIEKHLKTELKKWEKVYGKTTREQREKEYWPRKTKILKEWIAYYEKVKNDLS